MRLLLPQFTQVYINFHILTDFSLNFKNILFLFSVLFHYLREYSLYDFSVLTFSVCFHDPENCIPRLIFFFIFKLYIIVLVLPNIKMNLPQVYMCSPS